MTIQTNGKKYTVTASIQMPVTLKIEATNQDDANLIGCYQLNDMLTQQAYLTLMMLNGDMVVPRVGDIFIEVEEVLED